MAVPVSVNCQAMRHCTESIDKTEGSAGLITSRTGDSELKHIGITQSNRTGAYYQYGAMDAGIRRTDNVGITLVESQAIHGAKGVIGPAKIAFAKACADRNFHMNQSCRIVGRTYDLVYDHSAASEEGICRNYDR